MQNNVKMRTGNGNFLGFIFMKELLVSDWGVYGFFFDRLCIFDDFLRMCQTLGLCAEVCCSISSHLTLFLLSVKVRLVN